MSIDSNQQKINAYNSLSAEKRTADRRADFTAVNAWIDGSSGRPRTCEEALLLLHTIPLVIRVKLVPNWLDKVVASVNFANVSVSEEQQLQMASALFEDRRKLRGPDDVDATVDDFHLRLILEAATQIAAIMMGKKIKVTFARQTEGVATDLRVCTEQDTEHNMVN
ncbi:hypothetical protein B0H19DRAFT_1272796 [Mycena capillaripes]|nr:hypothetical protein B0H19DRAFT_1272796 [Mycena capillaripes]